MAQVKVTNTKIPVKPDTNKTNNGQKLPNTGQKITSWTMVLGLFLIAFVAVVIVIRRKVN
ncbi:LPXTG cell wall anchor domain-containing protein [Enterococcus italicus]|uniref:LPXTG cell wall anchor domain-containing protein n=1 Tax=Enterococcus italicus TaxID=246144 RepID=UPI0009F8131F